MGQQRRLPSRKSSHGERSSITFGQTLRKRDDKFSSCLVNSRRALYCPFRRVEAGQAGG